MTSRPEAPLQMQGANRGTFERFAQHLPRAWIEEALEAKGKASVRRRRLPAERVVWLVLGMALFRDLAIDWVIQQLGIALPAKSGKAPARSAGPQAKERLGSQPLEWLFEHSGKKWAMEAADQSRWRGLRVFGIDGSSARVPDSPANRSHFGGRSNGRGDSAYPLLRLVTLMALRAHLLLGARLGPYTESEYALARPLLEEVPEESLTILDRGFFFAELLIPLERRGKRAWLTRMRKNTAFQVVKRLGPGDAIVEMHTSWASRQRDESLPKTWQARAIQYKRKGFRPQWLVTSLLDAEKWPRDEIVELYHERWELELGYDEVKTEMLEREETIRSQKPDGVLQEAWGLLIAYNLIRLEMAAAAKKLGLPPTRLSFKGALHLVRTELLLFATVSPGTLPKRIDALDAALGLLVLPPRRSARRYPRAVKIKMSHYARKRPVSERRRRRRLN